MTDYHPQKAVKGHTLARIVSLFHLTADEAARELHICPTTFKTIARKLGVDRWPHRNYVSVAKAIACLESVDPDKLSAYHRIKLTQAISELIDLREQIETGYNYRACLSKSLDTAVNTILLSSAAVAIIHAKNATKMRLIQERQAARRIAIKPIISPLKQPPICISPSFDRGPLAVQPQPEYVFFRRMVIRPVCLALTPIQVANRLRDMRRSFAHSR